MSPISTAHLNPYVQTFCIASPGESILVPLLLNNTNPTGIRYTLTPLGYDEPGNGGGNGKAVGKVDRVDLSAKDLKAIEASRQESLQVARVAASAKRDAEDDDEYDYDDDEDSEEGEDSDTSRQGSKSSLQRSQTLVHLRINKPGIVRLERVMDTSNVEARLVFPAELSVVPCPSASFSSSSSSSSSSALSSEHSVRCAAPGLTSGSGEELELNIDVYGVPPLSLRWHKEVNGRREAFMVEGIEGGDVHSVRRLGAVTSSRRPEQLSVPLTVSLDALGRHSYVLESVTDALGNTVQVAANGDGNGKTTRSVDVLKRPSVSFRHCGPGNPAALLIGSDTGLTIDARSADSLDYPLDVQVKYTPPSDDELLVSGSKKLKAWVKTLHTPQNVSGNANGREVVFRANAPGEYAITKVNGRYCEGDVESPDVCRVVERPVPTAEIEWKKIHEW